MQFFFMLMITVMMIHIGFIVMMLMLKLLCKLVMEASDLFIIILATLITEIFILIIEGVMAWQLFAIILTF